MSAHHAALADDSARTLRDIQAVPNQAEESPSSRINTHSTSRGFRERLTTILRRSSEEDLFKQVGAAPTLAQSWKAVVFYSWFNLLLVFIPISWALHFALPSSASHDTLIFCCSFLAIMPLAKLLGFATEELSLRVGHTLGGLLNAILGNAVELIVAIVALIKCELQIVQSSLVGSILSNILLGLGMCFTVGGMKFSEQGFGNNPVRLKASLLTISVTAALLPAAFHFLIPVVSRSNPSIEVGLGSLISRSLPVDGTLSISRGSAVVLLWIYMIYLVFQLYSHKQLYNDDISDTDAPTPSHAMGRPSEKAGSSERIGSTSRSNTYGEPLASNGANGLNGLARQISSSSAPSISIRHFYPEVSRQDSIRDSESISDEEAPSLNLIATAVLMLVSIVLVAITSVFLVDSVDGVVASGHIRKEFVGLILLPIVGNSAEHISAITVSSKEALGLSLGVAVGSSIQIALFIIPFVVTLGWILGKPLTLLFDPLESLALFFSVLIVNYTTQDGKSNWSDGVILMSLYVILAVIFWYYPGFDIVHQLGLVC